MALTNLRLCRRFRDDTGANLVEAALILPVLLLLTFTFVEFATILYVQMALQNGVNQGARFAITRNVLPGLSREQSIKSIVKEEIPTLDIADEHITFSHMALGGEEWTDGTGGANTIERVTVTYSYPIMSPAVRPFFDSDVLTFRVTATMKNEGEPGL